MILFFLGLTFVGWASWLVTGETGSLLLLGFGAAGTAACLWEVMRA